MQVHEGRNHEVRELVKNAGLEVGSNIFISAIYYPNSYRFNHDSLVFNVLDWSNVNLILHELGGLGHILLKRVVYTELGVEC